MQEFKQQIQILKTEAAEMHKKPIALLEINKLMLANKTDEHLKNALLVLEKSSISEIELRVLKMTLQIYTYDTFAIQRALAIIQKGFTEVILCKECVELLPLSELVIDFFIPLCFTGSQVQQIGAQVCLSAIKEIPEKQRANIINQFLKLQFIQHQAMVDVITKILPEDNVQILQRALVALQDPKHSYRVKESLCKLLEAISKTKLQESVILQSIAVLKDLRQDRIQSVQVAAKSALTQYQSLIIAKQPVNQSYVEVKPFMKRKSANIMALLRRKQQVRDQLQKVVKQARQEPFGEQKQQELPVDSQPEKDPQFESQSIIFKDQLLKLQCDAYASHKKLIALGEINALMKTNNTEAHLKIVLNALEGLKVQYFGEIEMRIIKISLQIYKIDQIHITRILSLLSKGFQEPQLCGECITLLKEFSSEICEYFIPLALKSGPQITQQAAQICLRSIVESGKIEEKYRKTILNGFMKTHYIETTALIEIIIKIINAQDPVLQVLQRSLVSLQDSKHNYQIKQTLCKLIEHMAQFTIFDESTIISTITVLRELTFDRVASLQMAAKSALLSYQNIYILKNPPLVQNSVVVEKPKLKRGENHLNIEPTKQVKIKNKIEEALGRAEVERIQDQILQEQLQREQQEHFIAEDDICKSESFNDDFEKTQLFDEPEVIVRKFNNTIQEQEEESEMDKTVIYDDPLDATTDFNNTVWDVNRQFEEALLDPDTYQLMRMMLTIPNYTSQLSQETHQKLLNHFESLSKSGFFRMLFPSN